MYTFFFLFCCEDDLSRREKNFNCVYLFYLFIFKKAKTSAFKNLEKKMNHGDIDDSRGRRKRDNVRKHHDTDRRIRHENRTWSCPLRTTNYLGNSLRTPWSMGISREKMYEGKQTAAIAEKTLRKF
jgi:hypothetical protein